MSQLDQAKKEAKRLFNLAKANQENHSTNNITIENLSKAREILSVMNGYKNWHEYEEVLKRKDFMFDKVDKNTSNKINKDIFENQQYYIQDIIFNNIINPIVKLNQLIVEKEHQPIILGRIKEKTFFENKDKKWILNNFPALISGATGAGKSEVLASICSQFIENKEGVIYFDGKGDASLYSKFFAYATKHNRINDLFVLNFMTGSRDVFGHNENETKEKFSHSIDPINPMVGNDEYFNTFFGRIGIVIHAILKNIHHKNQLMDNQSLESILMLNNLITWSKHKRFKISEIDDYLVEIGLSLDDNNDEDDFNEALLKHAEICYSAFEILKLFKSYSYLFKLDCSINMEKIFLERKILIILLPALEKSTRELANLGSIICSQIKHIEEKYQRYNTHMQNIVIDEFTYFADTMKNINFNETKNNYIFGCMDYMFDNNIFNVVLHNVNTHVIMKHCSSPEVHNKIKLDLINNLEELPKLISKFDNKNSSFIYQFAMELRNLREGTGYVLSKNKQTSKDSDILNNEIKYYCQFINCEYLPAKYEKKTWLVNHPKPIIYISDNQLN